MQFFFLGLFFQMYHKRGESEEGFLFPGFLCILCRSYSWAGKFKPPSMIRRSRQWIHVPKHSWLFDIMHCQEVQEKLFFSIRHWYMSVMDEWVLPSGNLETFIWGLLFPSLYLRFLFSKCHDVDAFQKPCFVCLVGLEMSRSKCVKVSVICIKWGLWNIWNFFFFFLIAADFSLIWLQSLIIIFPFCSEFIIVMLS